MSRQTTLPVVLLIVSSLLAMPVYAGVDAEVAEADGGIGLNIDIGFATAFLYRGWNVFQDDSQLDRNMLHCRMRWPTTATSTSTRP